jgi:lysine decarboxylase
MIMAATNPGDKIIIPRNCHRSVYGAVILGRLIPIYISPDIDDELGAAMGINPEALEYILEKHKDAKAVVITNPTFYGTCSDLKRIAEITHKKGMLLLVDEAHGSHFAFNEKLPISALEAGADMTAQSIHKTLASMTQSSMLHVKSKMVDIEKLKLFLQLTQTTSPSHILLASLDAARQIMQEKGRELLEDAIGLSSWARGEINSIPGLYCPGADRIGRFGIADFDPTRLVVNFNSAGISGTKAEAILRKNFKIQVEMADLYNIVAISTIGDCRADFEKLVNSLRAVAEAAGEEKQGVAEAKDIFNKPPELSILPWEAVYCEKEKVEASGSIGRICGEMIIPYPPGIPVLMPGEKITADIVEYLRLCVRQGIKINGAEDPKLDSIRVIR